MLLNAVRKMLPTSGGIGRPEDIENALAALEDRLAEAQRRLDAAEQRRGLAALESDAAAAKNRAAIIAARDDIADLVAARDAVTQKLFEARAAEQVAAARELYERARLVQAATVKALKARLKKHFEEHLAIVELIETSRKLIAQANKNLPADAQYLPDPEAAVRDRPRIARELLAETKTERWVRCDNGRQINPDEVDDFRREGGPYATFAELTNRVGGETFAVATLQRVRCIGQIVVSRQVRAELPYLGVPSVSTIAMPGVRHDEPGYEPPASIDDPDFVLAAVQRARSDVRDPEPVRAVLTESSTEEIS